MFFVVDLWHNSSTDTRSSGLASAVPLNARAQPLCSPFHSLAVTVR